MHASTALSTFSILLETRFCWVVHSEPKRSVLWGLFSVTEKVLFALLEMWRSHKLTVGCVFDYVKSSLHCQSDGLSLKMSFKPKLQIVIFLLTSVIFSAYIQHMIF